MKKQYLTQVIIGEHNTTATPMWAGYGQTHAILTTTMRTHLYQRISKSNDDLYLSSDLKQYMSGLTGTAQRIKRRKW